MDPGCRRGGSIKVLELIQDHPAEFAYDFRRKFHLSIDDIGGSVSLRETVLLLAILVREPDSWLQAVLNDWKHPVSREWIVATHTFDLHAAVNSSKRPKPYPTPWVGEGKKRIGSNKQSREDVLRRLEAMNPKEDNGN